MLIQRMIRASKLEVALYEEVEADKSALSQAMLIVVLHSIAAGIGRFDEAGIIGLLAGTVGQLVSWFIWALLTYLIGAKLLPESQTEADLGQLLRTIGFAASPGVLLVLGVIPVISLIIQLLVSVWMLVAFVVAVRQALDYTSTLRTVVVCLLGWVVMVMVEVLLMFVLHAN